MGGGMGWIDLAHNMDTRQTPVNVVMNLLYKEFLNWLRMG
jgi:hypothetical protein